MAKQKYEYMENKRNATFQSTTLGMKYIRIQLFNVFSFYDRRRREMQDLNMTSPHLDKYVTSKQGHL